MFSGSLPAARIAGSLSSLKVTDCVPAPVRVADLPSYVIVCETAVRFGVKNTGVAETVTDWPFHARPVTGLSAFLPEAIVPITTSGLLRTATRSVDFVVTAVPEPDCVIACALIVQFPFLNDGTPLVVLNVAVLKLSVIGAEASSADGARFEDDVVCLATIVSVPVLPGPVQFMIRSTSLSFAEPGSTFKITSSWPTTFAKLAGTDEQLPNPHNVWLIDETVMVVGVVAPTVTVAAPACDLSAFDVAMMLV